jgi:hypothetical protein
MTHVFRPKHKKNLRAAHPELEGEIEEGSFQKQ